MEKFNEKKATALAVKIFKTIGVKRMLYKKLIKIMYFCDRQMYNCYDTFITNDTFLALDQGVVLSVTLNLIKSDYSERQTFWGRHFKTLGEDIELIDSVGDIQDILSSKEKVIVEYYSEYYKTTDLENLIELSHALLKEWSDPSQEGNGVHTITVNDLNSVFNKNPNTRNQEIIGNPQ